MSDTGYSDSQASQVDPDLMIDDLSYTDAKNYVMRFLTAEKRTEKMLQQKQEDFNKWNERLAFVEKQGTPEQLEKVKRELNVLISERDKLKAEFAALQRKNMILKEKLQHKAKDVGIPSSAFAEQLLRDFDQLVDVEDYKLQEAMNEQAAEDELAKLKAKLQGS